MKTLDNRKLDDSSMINYVFCSCEVLMAVMQFEIYFNYKMNFL